MISIQCDTIEEAAQELAAVREMVVNGKMNEQPAKVSKDITARFKAG